MVSSAGAPTVKDGFQDHETVGRGQGQKPSLEAKPSSKEIPRELRSENSDPAGKKSGPIGALMLNDSRKKKAAANSYDG